MAIVAADPTTCLQSFLTSAANVLGAQYILDSERDIQHYARSCSASSRRSLAIVQPGSTQDVQAIVSLASEHRIALYPISRGCNWGLGDACPTTENQVILDLRRMNRITTADAELGAFTVEPGVTQQQMYEYLQSNQLPFWYDASGAGPEASLIGNLMERGYGHTPLGERFQNTCNYHVVLADGSLIKTGFGEIENCAVKDLFKPGIGPSLDGLFTQSNLGIVTRATFWMTRIPEHFEAYAFQLDSDRQMEETIDALQPLRASGVISSALHIGNDFRVLSSRMQYPYDQLDGNSPFPDDLRKRLRREHGIGMWNGLGAYYGTRRGVRGFRADLTAALKGITKPIFLTQRRMAFAKKALSTLAWLPANQRLLRKLETAESVIALLQGKPVSDHLHGAAWRSRKKWDRNAPTPIERGDGILWYCPVIPCKSANVFGLNKALEKSLEEFGFEPLITYVLINARTVVCPITICFDSQCEFQTALAKKCRLFLQNICESFGYYSYRLPRQELKTGILGERLKNELDPQMIFSPDNQA